MKILVAALLAMLVAGLVAEAMDRKRRDGDDD